MVTTVNDGMAALDAIETSRPDIALLDIGMPGLNGYEVVERARAKVQDTVLMIAISGWGQQADKERAAAAGFDHHLTKPVEPSQLMALLRAAVSSK